MTLVLASCSDMPVKATYKAVKQGFARVTVYDPFETDKVRIRRHWRRVCWGRRTSLGVRAIEGVTLAAPARMPFGTKVVIPKLKGLVGDGKFIVQDRGKLERDGGRLDVFVNNHRKRNWLAKILPEYLEYYIE